MNKRKSMVILIIALCLVLIAAVSILVTLNLRDKSRPSLYLNLDAHLYTKNTQVRTPGEDGLYRMRFAWEGETVQYTVADKELVDYIDSMEVMGLTVTDDGQITEAFPATDIATEVCAGGFVKTIEGNRITANSSLSMNGSNCTVLQNAQTMYTDVTRGKAIPVLPTALRPMDGIKAYADENGMVTHIFITFRPAESPIYWLTERSYSAKELSTTRVPDEKGIYSLDCYSGGKLVTLKCKDKDLVTAIDTAAGDGKHFGFSVDGNGFITDYHNSAMSIRGLMVCDAYDVVAIDEDGTVHTKKLLSSKGESWSGKLAENFRAYDISATANAEGRMGQAVSGLQVGDRITLWTNTEDQAVEAYITTRLVDCPPYFNVSRKYDSEAKKTTRKADSEGYYIISLLKDGETQPVDYKTTDKSLATAIDKEASRCVSIVADENNVIQTVYTHQSLFGQSAWSSGGVVSSVTGSVVTRQTYGKPSTANNAVMLPDCKVYNVSTTGTYGEITTLQKGDYIYAFRQPSGELVHIYIVRRCLGADTLYYNIGRQYDAETKGTLRTPDGNGFYTFTLSHQGQTVKLKTDDKSLADALDSFSPGAVSLLVEGDQILEVNDPKYALGGSQVANGYIYGGVGEKGKHVATAEDGTEATFTMADDCKVYHYRNGATTLKEGDKITVYTDMDGNACVIFVR